MKTTKPISTISYNSKDYLILKLNELKTAKIISIWHFIAHLPEDDEGGKKNHFHLYIEPSKLIQTDDLKEHFAEYDPLNPDKPKNIIQIKPSKFGDWCLYGLHDSAYLASKGQSRKYHYVYEDFITSDTDELYSSFKSIDRTAIEPILKMQEYLQDGLTFTHCVKSGLVPVPQVRNFKMIWDLLLSDTTYRAERTGHETITALKALDDPRTVKTAKSILKQSSFELDENNPFK